MIPTTPIVMIPIDKELLDTHVSAVISASRVAISAGDQAIKSKAAADAAVSLSLNDDAVAAAAHNALDQAADGLEELKQAGYASPVAATTPAGSNH